MSGEDILRERENRPYYVYLHKLLSRIYGDDVDLAITEIEQKFTPENLKDWYNASMDPEEWWLEPQDDKGVKYLNNWRAVNKFLKNYGINLG